MLTSGGGGGGLPTNASLDFYMAQESAQLKSMVMGINTAAIAPVSSSYKTSSRAAKDLGTRALQLQSKMASVWKGPAADKAGENLSKTAEKAQAVGDTYRPSAARTDDFQSMVASRQSTIAAMPASEAPSGIEVIKDNAKWFAIGGLAGGGLMSAVDYFNGQNKAKEEHDALAKAVHQLDQDSKNYEAPYGVSSTPPEKKEPEALPMASAATVGAGGAGMTAPSAAGGGGTGPGSVGGPGGGHVSGTPQFNGGGNEPNPVKPPQTTPPTTVSPPPPVTTPPPTTTPPVTTPPEHITPTNVTPGTTTPGTTTPGTVGGGGSGPGTITPGSGGSGSAMGAGGVVGAAGGAAALGKAGAAGLSKPAGAGAPLGGAAKAGAPGAGGVTRGGAGGPVGGPMGGRGAAGAGGGARGGQLKRGVGSGSGAVGRGAGGGAVGRGGGAGGGARGGQLKRGVGSGSGAGKAAGGNGMAGGRGAGKRRNGEDLDGRPDYLVESDDVWGDGDKVSRPVLGE